MSQGSEDSDKNKSKKIGLLSEGERKFLKGEKDNPGYKPKVKKKAQLFPDFLITVIKEINLLDKKGYLDEKIRENTAEKVISPDSFVEFLLSDASKQDEEHPLTGRPPGWVWGNKIGYLATLPNLMNEKRKMLTLLGLHDALFEDIISYDNLEKFKRHLKKLEETAQELKEKWENMDTPKMKQILSKCQEVIKEFFEEKRIPEVKYEPVVKSLSYAMPRKNIRNSDGELDKEIIKRRFKEYVKKQRILERFTAMEGFSESIESLREINFRGLEGIEVFRAGFKDYNKSSRRKITEKLKEEKGTNVWKGYVTKVITEISELEPRIVKIDGINYSLTDYGKCLRDYLFQYVERGHEKYLPAVRNLSDYWMKVLDEHFSSSSENESKEV